MQTKSSRFSQEKTTRAVGTNLESRRPANKISAFGKKWTEKTPRKTQYPVGRCVIAEDLKSYERECDVIVDLYNGDWWRDLLRTAMVFNGPISREGEKDERKIGNDQAGYLIN